MNAQAALQRLAHWKTVFAGWQLGTRPIGDPECDAVRDHREITIMLRAEMNALVSLLVTHGVCTAQEWEQTLAEEADLLSQHYAMRFPGFHATDVGLDIDLRAAKTMKGWRP